MTTTSRETLTRERVVETAVRFADEHGVEAMSMRKLGAELGVEAMSLYNHVDDKGDLYDGMIDYVFSAIPLPDDGLGWKDQARLIGRAAIDEFTRHPWVVSLLMQRGNTGPAALAFMDHVLGVLIGAGFGDEDAHHGWQMLASHTMGYTFQSSTSTPAQEENYSGLELDMVRIAQEYPHVARLAPLLLDCSWETEYMFGLEIILDGLEARLERD